MMDVASAARAYASATRALSTGPTTGGKEGFGDMLQTALDTISNGSGAETKVADLAAGKTDIVNLVTAVAESEVAVETLVTIRDRVISAYQEIMNMPI